MKILKDLAISDSGFVFNPLSGESFQVNDIGVSIINCMKKDKSTDEITERISDEYEVLPSELEKDLTDFINMLKHYNLLVV